MDRAELLELFFQESGERLRELEPRCSGSSARPGDADLLGLVFRCAHNLKAAAR